MLWYSNKVGLRLRSGLLHSYFLKKFSTTCISHEIFKCVTVNRAHDKIHRSYFRSLERERVKYNRSVIKIEPNIKDLLYLFQKELKGDINSVSLNKSYVPPGSKFKSLLEPVTFHCILALHYLSNRYNNCLPEKYLNEQSSFQRNYLISILQKITHKNSSISDVKSKIERESNISISLEASKLLDLYSIGETSESDREILELSVLAFVTVSKEKHQGKYTIENDLSKWIASINESNISGACGNLRNLTEIPSFVLYDILIRTPMSSSEYLLQVDIWLDYMKDIAIYYFENINAIKLCFNNLLFYGAHQYPDILPKLINMTLSFFSDTKTGYKFKLINTDYINQIVWNLAYDRIRSASPTSKLDNSLLKAQEIAVKCGQSIENFKASSNTLDLKAHMGIVLAINSISSEKARKLFHVAEKRFILGDSHSNDKDLIAYNATKILLSTTPEQLLNNFNVAAVTYSHSSTLWLVFIKKLSSFGLLNEQRSLKIIRELVANDDTLIVSKDIILMLLLPIKRISGMNSFISILNSLKNNLTKLHLSSILPKYLAILYRSRKAKVRRFFPWEKSPKQELKFDSTIEYARYIYKTKFRKLTLNIVGIMLNGEVNIQPDRIFDLYKNELNESNLLPDASCLAALFRAALKSRNNSNILWGDMYAPQIAIHEFKQNTISSSSIQNKEILVIPDNHLWQLYIQLLFKFDYVSELSTIIRWWEDINFSPSRETLLMLLQALPKEISSRYIQHIEKVNNDSVKLISHSEESTITTTKSSIQWPWPTLDEWNHNSK